MSCPALLVLSPDPIDLTAKKFVDWQFRVLELRQHMKRGIDRLDDADKRPRHAGMTNGGLVIAPVDALGAAPEELDRRRSVLAERFSLFQDSELVRIERQLRDEELARSRFRLKFTVRHLQRRQERVERLFEQLGRDRPKIVVAGFDRPDHHAESRLARSGCSSLSPVAQPYHALKSGDRAAERLRRSLKSRLGKRVFSSPRSGYGLEACAFLALKPPATRRRRRWCG